MDCMFCRDDAEVACVYAAKDSTMSSLTAAASSARTGSSMGWIGRSMYTS